MEIKGTVGAGDVYAAGVLYGVIKNFSLDDSMKLATAAAASSLQEEDSTSGIKRYGELITMFETQPFETQPKNKYIRI